MNEHNVVLVVAKDVFLSIKGAPLESIPGTLYGFRIVVERLAKASVEDGIDDNVLKVASELFSALKGDSVPNNLDGFEAILESVKKVYAGKDVDEDMLMVAKDLFLALKEPKWSQISSDIFGFESVVEEIREIFRNCIEEANSESKDNEAVQEKAL